MTNNLDYYNKEMEIYGFCFGGTSLNRVLYKLKEIDCCYIIFPNNIEHYLAFLLRDQPAYILGLGSYSGMDQDKIRIETVCSNQFRNDFVGGDICTRIAVKPFLNSNLTTTKYGNAMGNSYCNLLSWKIMKLINSGELKSKYTFLHIPRTIKSWVARAKIDNALASFKTS